MALPDTGSFSEPSPRWAPFSGSINENFYLWGGYTEDFKENGDSVVASTLHSFDHLLESWNSSVCTGPPPPGLYGGACASIGRHLYVYGGSDKIRYQQSLYRLDVDSLKWDLLSSHGPLKGCGYQMVTHCHELVLFGGFGFTRSSEPGAEYIKTGRSTDIRVLTNQLHTYGTEKGMFCFHTAEGLIHGI